MQPKTLGESGRNFGKFRYTSQTVLFSENPDRKILLQSLLGISVNSNEVFRQIYSAPNLLQALSSYRDPSIDNLFTSTFVKKEDTRQLSSISLNLKW